MTITDKKDGAPVPDNRIVMRVDGIEGAFGACGELDSDGDYTDADGQVSVTYTASDESATCNVIATESLSGTTEVATIYQGDDRENAASVSAAFPSEITVGAGPKQFTTTITNPTPNDIHGARLTFLMAGNNTATEGASAEQVHVQFANAATAFQYVDVDLAGTTVDDGTIYGYLGDELGADFPGSSARTTKLRVSFDASVPPSVTTGYDLVIEIQLDQFNAASGSTTNLGYIGTNDITVLPAEVTPRHPHRRP